jgi:hypothetical protein
MCGPASVHFIVTGSTFCFAFYITFPGSMTDEQNLAGAESPTEAALPPAPVDDFSYLDDITDNFSGPFREEWERNRETRFRAQEEEEQQEVAEMAARAAAARDEFLRKIQAERDARITRSRESLPDPPPIEQGDLAGGWERVMAMVGPKAAQVPPAKARQFKNLYFQLKG